MLNYMRADGRYERWILKSQSRTLVIDEAVGAVMSVTIDINVHVWKFKGDCTYGKIRMFITTIEEHR